MILARREHHAPVSRREDIGFSLRKAGYGLITWLIHRVILMPTGLAEKLLRRPLEPLLELNHTPLFSAAPQNRGDFISFIRGEFSPKPPANASSCIRMFIGTRAQPRCLLDGAANLDKSALITANPISVDQRSTVLLHSLN
jgi:hypothetical protein